MLLDILILLVSLKFMYIKILFASFFLSFFFSQSCHYLSIYLRLITIYQCINLVQFCHYLSIYFQLVIFRSLCTHTHTHTHTHTYIYICIYIYIYMYIYILDYLRYFDEFRIEKCAMLIIKKE